MWKFMGYQIRTLPNFLFYYVSMLSPLENVKVHVVNELEHILRFIQKQINMPSPTLLDSLFEYLYVRGKC